MIRRETCEHCQWQGQLDECATCPALTVYEVLEERKARSDAREARAIAKRHKRISIAKKIGKAAT